MQEISDEDFSVFGLHLKLTEKCNKLLVRIFFLFFFAFIPAGATVWNSY